MTFKVVYFLVLVVPMVLGYCPQCERNAQFMNLMNQLRPNNGINSNVRSVSGVTGIENGNGAGLFGASYGINSNGNLNNFGQWNSNLNGMGNGVAVNSLNVETGNNGIVPGYSSQQQNFNGQIGNLPIRFINTGGYGCCSNNYGPCCNNNANGFKAVQLNDLANLSQNTQFAHSEPQNIVNANLQQEGLQTHTETIPSSKVVFDPVTFKQYQTTQLQQ